MTVCITNTALPGIRRCTIPGVHKVTCHDHPGWVENPGTCRGCLPREATHGHLCEHCYQTAVNALAAWPAFREALDATEGRAVSPEAGGRGSAAMGFANLSLVFLAVDECERHLESRHGMTVDAWIETEAGAADAVMFAHAAANAWASLEVEEREKQIVRERCPNCTRLTAFGHVTREERGVTIVTCDFCGHELSRVRPDIIRWKGSPTCEHLMHADCDAVDCRCDCHLLGVQSRPGGVQALWDADQHAVTARRRTGHRVHTWREPRAGEWFTRRTIGDVHEHHDTYRATWVIQDALTIEPNSEEKAA